MSAPELSNFTLGLIHIWRSRNFVITSISQRLVRLHLVGEYVPIFPSGFFGFFASDVCTSHIALVLCILLCATLVSYLSFYYVALHWGHLFKHFGLKFKLRDLRYFITSKNQHAYGGILIIFCFILWFAICKWQTY